MVDDVAAQLRIDILDHLQMLRLPIEGDDNSDGVQTKDCVRNSHQFQRLENIRRERSFSTTRWDKLVYHFANGTDIVPEDIDPELIPVVSGAETGYLFRLATLLWSVPVSRGFGRRMRYLVRDRSNGKLIGIFALGDPVFNLRARDQWIGWSIEHRRTQLVNVMDAYVVGAVPPYAQLLGGKLVTALISSSEVNHDFIERYGDTTGIISKVKKEARLALVTVTSALGRSSLYNRVKLATQLPHSERQVFVHLQHIGETQGFGHFQLSENLFERLRILLAEQGHPYANGHQFGQGPNWRMRVARVGLSMLGLDKALMRHGITRSVYAMPLANNFREYLLQQENIPTITRPSAADIATAARQRWVIPRARRFPQYTEVTRDDYLQPLKDLLIDVDTVPSSLATQQHDLWEAQVD